MFMIDSSTGSFFLEVLSTSLKSFVFLDDNFILGSSCPQRKRPALLVYSLKQRPADDSGTTRTSTHLLRFLLGTDFLSPRGESDILLASDPSPGWQPNTAVPFHNAGDERIIAMHSKFFDGMRGATFMIFAKALLRQIQSLPHDEGLDVEWEVHGPQLIELVQGQSRHYERWPFPVFGTRYVLPGIGGGRPEILIRDLSPRRYLRASKEERKESDALYEASAWPNTGNRNCKPNPRSILTRVPLPRDIIMNRHTRFCLSEDGIIIVEKVREPPAYSQLRDSYDWLVG